MRQVLFVILLLISLPAVADETKGTTVSLHASATRMLSNDEVVVRFRIEASGHDAAALRRKVNRISQAVRDRLGREKGVVLLTTGRRLEPIWRDDKLSHRRLRDGWHLVQTGQAKSRDIAAVAGWVDAIEHAGAHLDGLRFRVSVPTMQKAEDGLRQQAIARFRTEAASAAKALGASSFRILRLGEDIDRPGPRPVMAMARAAASPALSAGESRVTVTVRGAILLPDKDYRVR